MYIRFVVFRLLNACYNIYCMISMLALFPIELALLLWCCFAVICVTFSLITKWIVIFSHMFSMLSVFIKDLTNIPIGFWIFCIYVIGQRNCSWFWFHGYHLNTIKKFLPPQIDWVQSVFILCEGKSLFVVTKRVPESKNNPKTKKSCLYTYKSVVIVDWEEVFVSLRCCLQIQ